jgi:hypothetical protein
MDDNRVYQDLGISPGLLVIRPQSAEKHHGPFKTPGNRTSKVSGELLVC